MARRGLRDLLSSLRRSSNEDFFLNHIDRKRVPVHVAIIMDGNGRWAARRGLPRIAGHKAGAEAVREVIKAASEIGVRYLTLYTFSAENWKRPPEEVEALMHLIDGRLRAELAELHEKGVKVRVIGNLSRMPDFLQASFRKAEELTAKNEGLNLQVALNYSARMEIKEAARRMAEEAGEGKLRPEEITEESFSTYLYTTGIPDPELLVRTGGEMRLSNFLLWQVAYAELWVTSIYWPEFGRRDFFQAIYEFQQRHRRYGGLEDL